MSSRGVLGVLLTGTIEAGKSSLAVELGELLARRHLPAAIVDLDWLGWFEPPAESGLTVDELIATNLEAVWPNFRDAGALSSCSPGPFGAPSRSLVTGARSRVCRCGSCA